jgi:ABC-type transporter Mla MlaB component
MRTACGEACRICVEEGRERRFRVAYMQFVTIKNDTAVLAVKGTFNFGLCKRVNSELEVAMQNGCTKVTVDFDETKFIDSASIRMLCDVRDRVRPDNFSAGNAHGKVMTVLQNSNLGGWLKF